MARFCPSALWLAQRGRFLHPANRVVLWQSAKDHITTWWLHDLRPYDFHD